MIVKLLIFVANWGSKDYVDGALSRLREELAREIQRLDARLNSMVLSSSGVVDVEVVELQSVDLPDPTENSAHTEPLS